MIPVPAIPKVMIPGAVTIPVLAVPKVMIPDQLRPSAVMIPGAALGARKENSEKQATNEKREERKVGI